MLYTRKITLSLLSGAICGSIIFAAPAAADLELPFQLPPHFGASEPLPPFVAHTAQEDSVNKYMDLLDNQAPLWILDPTIPLERGSSILPPGRDDPFDPFGLVPEQVPFEPIQLPAKMFFEITPPSGAIQQSFDELLGAGGVFGLTGGGTIPAPGALSLLGLGAAALLGRRRRTS